ncbi:MAG: Na+/H+ antiporter subunit E [Actinobacteria bacterium]|nr:Na+/H+ antiporter subunit E [Actinomycetota bacterium]
MTRTPSIPLLVWLVAVWVALWEQVSPANVASGLVVALVVLTLFPLGPRDRSARVRPAAALRFLVYFAWKLVEASAIVAWEVVTPRNRINEGIVAIPIRGVSDVVITVVANAISLTPGTLTLEARRSPAVLYVHVLHLRDVEEVRRETLHLEALAIRAFGPPEVAAALASEGDSAVASPPPSTATRAPRSGGQEGRP